MTSAQHAEGRQFAPGLVYLRRGGGRARGEQAVAGAMSQTPRLPQVSARAPGSLTTRGGIETQRSEKKRRDEKRRGEERRDEKKKGETRREEKIRDEKRSSETRRGEAHNLHANVMEQKPTAP